MKKLYIVLFCMSLSLFTQAQDLYLLNSNLTINSADVNATDLEDKTYLVNNSNQSLTIEYTINGGNLVTYAWPASAVGICNDATCDDPSVKVNGSFIIDNNDSVEIKISVLPEGISDSIGGTIRFNAPGTTISRVSATYSIKVGTVTTAINELDTKSLTIYPNPATNFIQIKGVNNIDQINKVELYNIIGRKVFEKHINSTNDLHIDIQNYESGIYLIKLFDESTKLFYTKTFVKK